jgi:uncharacterized protein YndB with AHSA1/START domain
VISFRTEQTIERSAHDVWTYAADVARHPDWMGVSHARLVSGHATEVGSRAVERMKFGPRSIDVGLEVSAAIPARRIAWRIAGGSPMQGEVALELEALDPHRTRATWSGSIGLTGPWRLLEPLMASEVKSGEAAELRHLKDNLERNEIGVVGGRS